MEITMKLSAEGAEFVRTHEGFVGKYYLDPVGIPTIGVGFTWRSASFREWWRKNKGSEPFQPGARISRSQADDALRFLVEREYGKAVNDFLGKTVAQHVYDGMVSPVFNLGPGSLKWKWAAAAKKGDYSASAERLRSTGTTAKGKKLKGLVTRRIEEAELLEFGDYTVGQMPKTVKTPILRRGERGQRVKDLQSDLTQVGSYDGRIDGIFGYGTERAVMEFQVQHSLKVDGWAGPKTLERLQSVANDNKLGDKPASIPTGRYIPDRPPLSTTTKPRPKAPKRGKNNLAAAFIAIAILAVGWLSGWGQQILEAIQGVFQ